MKLSSAFFAFVAATTVYAAPVALPETVPLAARDEVSFDSALATRLWGILKREAAPEDEVRVDSALATRLWGILKRDASAEDEASVDAALATRLWGILKREASLESVEV